MTQGLGFVLLSIHTFARRGDFVEKVRNLRPIVNRPALWGSQSWLQPAFSRLSSPRVTSVSAAKDAPEGAVPRSSERVRFGAFEESGLPLAHIGLSPGQHLTNRPIQVVRMKIQLSQ